MIHTRLKAETRSYHERIEQIPLARRLLAATVDRAYYTHVLASYYGFYMPLEVRLVSAADWSLLGFELAPRLKTPLLAQDLASMGVASEQLHLLPTCSALPRLIDLPAAIGCMYVLEGATLGSQLILRHLSATLGFSAQAGAAFFSSYGPAVGAMWRAFRAFADEYAPGHEDAIVASACATFAVLEGWFTESYTRIAASQDARIVAT